MWFFETIRIIARILRFEFENCSIGFRTFAYLIRHSILEIDSIRCNNALDSSIYNSTYITVTLWFSVDIPVFLPIYIRLNNFDIYLYLLTMRCFDLLHKLLYIDIYSNNYVFTVLYIYLNTYPLRTGLPAKCSCSCWQAEQGQVHAAI
jgi:hypothetical protein